MGWLLRTPIVSSPLIPWLAVVLLGCAANTGAAGPDEEARSISLSERIPVGPEAERSPDGLVRVLTPDQSVLLYVMPPRPDLLRVDRMVLYPASIQYKEGVRGWSEGKEDRLRRHFDNALRSELSRAAGWQIAEDPGPGVLTVLGR